MSDVMDNFMRNQKFAFPADSYLTELDPKTEAAFGQWAAANQNRIGPRSVVDDPFSDYDYRGWFQANQGNKAPEGHFTDTYKTPYHESFSNESMYADPKTAPSWVKSGKGWKLMTKDGIVIKDESQ